MDQPWTLSPVAALAHFGTDPAKGLTGQQVDKQREKFGKNGATNCAIAELGHVAHY
jgi:Ca2+ transporting ATPase